MSKTLIAYYSRRGENYVNGSITNIEIGNNEIIKDYLKKIIGDVDTFHIIEKEEYSKSYMNAINEAKDDLKNKKRPELKEYLDSIDEYDTIYLVYPIYWGTFPMAVYTFLEKYNFDGKKIKPIATHEGSKMGTSERELEITIPCADIKKGLPIQGGTVRESKTLLESFVNND